jgi:hypothetical protein
VSDVFPLRKMTKIASSTGLRIKRPVLSPHPEHFDLQ